MKMLAIGWIKNTKTPFIIMGIIVAVIIAVQGLMIRDLYARSERHALGDIKSVLIDTITGLNTDPAVNPATGALSIPADKLVFPANPSVRWYYRGGELGMYAFADAQNQSQALSRIHSAQTLPDVFQAVATAKACGRQVVMTLGEASPEEATGEKLTLITKVTLNDGRIVTLFENSACPAGSEALMQTLSKVQNL